MAKKRMLPRDVMAEHGLFPDDILPDGCFHKFSAGEKRDGGIAWYIASRDGATVEFGHPADGLERAYWDRDGAWYGPGEALDPKDSELAPAIERAQTIWKRGTRKPTGHPYLVDRGISTGLRQLKLSKETELPDFWRIPEGLLLVPVRLGGNQLVNLQMIRPDGISTFLPGAPVHDTWVMIGGDRLKDRKPLYVCVGWPTGWTIHQATGCAVVVCSCASALRSAAVRLKKHYKCRVIVAAANDRWNEFYQGPDAELVPNPGVHFAKKAARDAEVEFAIPEFKSLGGCPVSFDDLRQREGFDAVRQRLDTERVNEATTTLLRTAEPEPGMMPENPETDPRLADAPFRCLGYYGAGLFASRADRYWFLTADGKAMGLARSQLGKVHLRRLTGWPIQNRGWWTERFSSRGGRSGRARLRQGGRGRMDWSAAADALIHECYSAGDFESWQIRGTGCWRDEDGNVVVHRGDQLLAPGATKPIPPEDYVAGAGEFVYERSDVAPRPLWENPLSLTDARQLLRWFEQMPWDDEAAGVLFAGFLALGPVAGILEERPHLWLTGSEAIGISTLTGEEVAGELLGGVFTVLLNPGELRCSDLVRDARVRIYSCPWIDSKDGVANLKAALPRKIANQSLVLLSSSSVPTSLSGEIGDYLTHLHLRDPSLIANERDQRNARSEVRRLRDWLQSKYGQDTGCRLHARILGWVRSWRFDRLLDVATEVAEDEWRWGPRHLAGHHILAVGAMMLCYDSVPDKDEVRGWFRKKRLTAAAAETSRSGYDVLAGLLQGELEVALNPRSRERLTVDTALKYVIAGEPRVGPNARATRIRKRDRWRRVGQALARAGLRVEDNALLVANQSDWIRDQLADSPYAADWKKALRTIPRAHGGPPRGVVCKGEGTKRRTTVIPLRAVYGISSPL